MPSSLIQSTQVTMVGGLAWQEWRRQSACCGEIFLHPELCGQNESHDPCPFGVICRTSDRTISLWLCQIWIPSSPVFAHYQLTTTQKWQKATQWSVEKEAEAAQQWILDYLTAVCKNNTQIPECTKCTIFHSEVKKIYISWVEAQTSLHWGRDPERGCGVQQSVQF